MSQNSLFSRVRKLAEKISDQNNHNKQVQSKTILDLEKISVPSSPKAHMTA